MSKVLRLILVLSLLTAAGAVVPVPVHARAETSALSVPGGLQEAILSSTVKPFQAGGGKYSTSAGGMDLELNASGLQAGGEGWGWAVALQGFGRVEGVKMVAAPEVRQAAGRVEYQRGVLTEWYRDTALGVEQGFTIHEAPLGEAELILELSVVTDMQGVPDEDARGISFPVPDGRTLRYDKLIAFDANGVELEAGMILTPGRIQIRVNDQGAQYPLTIDPLIYLEQKVVALDGTVGDYFGWSVALSGDTALVGAHLADVGGNLDQGAAYIFVRSGITWTLEAKLTALDGAAGDQFGNSVALSGDTALVGASWDDVDAKLSQGSAYVFVRDETGWTQQAHLTASDGGGGNEFGYSVSLSGDLAVVGAPRVKVGANYEQGAAYAFLRSGTAWTEDGILTALDGGQYDYFGTAVAVSGDKVLVGAPYHDIDLKADQGSVYFFNRIAGTWSPGMHPSSWNGEAGDNFGASVAISGETSAVGSPGDDEDAKNNQGSITIFESYSGGMLETKLFASDGAAGDYLGGSVAVSGDTAISGAINGGSVEQGVAYIFVRSGGWTQQQKLTASDGLSGDGFGYSVALSGDTALAGAYYDTPGVPVYQGSAYFYQAYRTDTDLAVSAVRGRAAHLHAGDTVFLTASVLNYGPASAPFVLLNVALPAGLTYLSHLTTHGTYGTYSRSINSWSVGTLPMGVTATLTIAATVDAMPSQTLFFTPYLLGQDIDDSNNTASLALPVFTPHEIALNGGFNTYVGTSKIPKFWTASGFASTDGKNTAYKKEGTASVMLAGASGANKVLTQTLNIAGVKGDEFQFSFWMRGVSIPLPGTCSAQVLLYNGAALASTKTLNYCSSFSPAFLLKSLSFTAPTAYTKIVIKLGYAKASGTVWLDGLSLMKAP